VLGRFGTLLRGIAADPGLRVSELPLLDSEERARVLDEWNATASPFAADLLVHHRVSAPAARTPHAVAVSHRGEALT
jgi:non-ribosomal peptide synthetase component F